MKRRLRYILLTATVIVALVCAVSAFVACGSQSDIVELRVENAKISFMRGDAFETGADFTVYAEYKDGTVTDVTAEATVRQESGMDMNVPGNYQITVSYGGKRVIYTVYVNDSEDILRKLELDSSAVKKQYRLGDKISLDGLVLNLTYENAQGVTFPVSTTSLRNFDVVVKGEDGTVVSDVFTSLGAFTVTVSQGSIKASFGMSVEGINISSVQSAIAVGGFYADKVVSGTSVINEAYPKYGIPEGENEPILQPKEPFEAYRYEYLFGVDHTYFKDVHDPDNIMAYNCSMDDDGIFVVYTENDVIKPSGTSNAAMMGGAPFRLWYYKDNIYGVENVLDNLYKRALQCSNGDLEETANEQTRTYTFAFSGLEFRDRDYDYFETNVKFTLSDDYTVATLEFTQDYYENNSAVIEDESDRTFVTDPVTGKTTPQGDFSHRTIASATQVAGERTARNEYTRDMFKISSYKLTCNGEEIENGGELACDVVTKNYVLEITDILPRTADFVQDFMYFDYEGNRNGTGIDTMVSNEHFTVYKSGSQIRISVFHGGTWTLIFKTSKTVRTLTISVKGNAPSGMTAQVRNEASGTFYASDKKTVALNGVVYFYGAVDAYADSEQTARVTSPNGSAATVESVVIAGVKCFKFSASEEGDYSVEVVSTANPDVRCAFTFTVSEIADFVTILNGKYTVKDQVGNIYELIFEQAEGDTVRGSVTVTRTPTDNDDNPLPDQAVSETLEFCVDEMEITVTHNADDKLWVEFEVDENNNLILIDQGNRRYTLMRAQ